MFLSFLKGAEVSVCLSQNSQRFPDLSSFPNLVPKFILKFFLNFVLNLVLKLVLNFILNLILNFVSNFVLEFVPNPVLRTVRQRTYRQSTFYKLAPPLLKNHVECAVKALNWMKMQK